MSHTSVPLPPSSCPKCSSKEINIGLTKFPFIYTGFCYHCNNNRTSQDKITFYQCVCCLPYETRAATIGYTSRFPCCHKVSVTHQQNVTLCTQLTQPSSESFNVVQDNGEMSLNFSTLSSDTHADMETASVIDNRMGIMLKFPLIFDSKEHLDSFLQLKIKASTKKDIIFTYDNEFQDYHEAAIAGKGANYIVNYALTKQVDTYSTRSDSDTLFLFLYSKLTSTMSRKEQAVLVSLIDHVLYDKNVYIPRRTADIRTKLHEGPHSLQEKLPHPRATELKMGYSVLSLETHIRHLFSTNNPPYPFLVMPESIHAKTTRGQQLLQTMNDIKVAPGTFLYPIQIGLWSDAFNPHNFNVKSVHCCIVTIGGREGDHSGRCSKPYWLGPAQNSTDEVENHLVDELNMLGTGYTANGPFLVYHKLLKRIVQVVICPFSFLCDRPDKAHRTGTMMGGTYHLLYGCTGKFTTIIDKVVCCEKCYRKLLLRENIGKDSTTKCKHCYSLDTSLMEYEPDENYPIDQFCSPQEKKLKFKRITFESLLAACHVGFKGVSKENWTKPMLQSYLKTEGLNTSIIKMIYDSGFLQKTYIAIDNHTTTLTKEQILNHQKEQRLLPNTFPYDKLPKFWGLRNMDISDFPGGLGHQIFLGVMKALCAFLKRYLLSQHKLISFSEKLDVKLAAIHKLLTTYLPISSKSGSKHDPLTFGGWISRNYLTLTRLCKWLFCHLDNCNTKKHPFGHLPTHDDYKKYTWSDMLAWCRHRGINTNTLPMRDDQRFTWFYNLLENPEIIFKDYTKSEIIDFIEDNYPEELDYMSTFIEEKDLKQEFQQYVKKHNIIPPPYFVTDTTMVKQDNDLKEIFGLFLAVVSRLMGPDGNDPQEIDRYVKLFLTKVHLVDKKLLDHAASIPLNKKSQKKTKRPSDPLLCKTPNFITMLNLPSEVAKFDHLRFMWELGGGGEGYIPLLKQYIYDLRENFSSNALNAVMRKVAYSDQLEMLLTNMSLSPDSEKPDSVENMQQAATHYIMKSTATNGLSNACHVIGDQLLGDGNTYVDSENNNIQRYGSIDAHPLYQLHNEIAIPIVVQLSTGNQYFLLLSKTEELLIPLHFRLSQPECVFNAWYFQFKSFQGNLQTIHTSDIYQRDLICALLLQHPSKKTYYYCLRMDWKELLLNVDTNRYEFAYPGLKVEMVARARKRKRRGE